MDDRGRLILLCGLPGSGKTTLACRLADELRAVRLSPDDWLLALAVDRDDQTTRGKVEALQWDVARQVVLGGGIAVLEAGFWSRAERDAKRDWARANDVAVELRFLDAPVDELWRRVASRDATLPPGAYVIGRHELEEWATWIEPPDAAELAQFDPPIAR